MTVKLNDQVLSMVKSTGAKVEGRALRESANDKRYISSAPIMVLVTVRHW